jgi:hypothetical protein
MRSAGQEPVPSCPLIAGIEKRLVHRYMRTTIVFQRRWLRQTDTAMNTERFIFVPTDE